MLESIPIIGGVARWLRNVRDAQALAQQAAFDKEKIALMKQITDTEQDNRKLRNENDALREGTTALRKQIADAAADTSRIVYDQNAAWKVRGEQREGPYCQTCNGNDRTKLVPLTLSKKSESGVQAAICGNCKTRVLIQDTNAVEPPEPPSSPRRRNAWDEDRRW